MDKTHEISPDRYKVGEQTFIPGLEKLIVLQDEDDDTGRNVTFVLTNEDHTMGNSLRYILMKDERVDFCGYCVPHPSEKKIHLRVQTKSTEWPALVVLSDAIERLGEVCDHVLDTFDTALAQFNQSHQ